MKNHSVKIHGHATSVSLEDEFWSDLKQIAKRENVSLASLITQIDDARGISHNLSSALRLFVLEDWRKKAIQDHSN